MYAIRSYYAAAHHRLEMARRGVAGNPRFVLDEREIRKSSPSYSVETLTALREEMAPGTPLILFMGADAFMGLTTWHRWQELLDLAHLAVAHRPGFVSAVWEDALPEPFRITSYNVCYTKLLRCRWIRPAGFSIISAGWSQRRVASNLRNNFV